MNAAETIKAAVDKLTALTAQSQKWSPAPWIQDSSEATDANENLVAACVINEDAELIVTLRRTVAAQAAVLAHTLRIRTAFVDEGLEAAWEGAVERAGDLDLAKAILGDAEPEQTERDPEEHTDRMARHLDEDADSAAINAQIEGLA